MCETTCNQCIKCKKTKVKNHGTSICFDYYGNRKCGYYSLCLMDKTDVVACKLFFENNRKCR